MDVQQTINDAATQYGLDPDLLLRQAYQESGLKQSSVSSAGAKGIMQLMPKTASDLGVDPDDPVQNIYGGAKYMRQMLDQFGGSYPHALAAYNAGPARVQDYINKGTPLPSETQKYVPAIMGGNGALSATNQSQGTPMPTNNTGALSASSMLGPGVINAPNDWSNALQGAGGGLVVAGGDAKGGAAMIAAANDAKAKQQALIAQMAHMGQPQLVDAGADPISGRNALSYSTHKLAKSLQ